MASHKDLFVEGHTSTEPGSGRRITICQLVTICQAEASSAPGDSTFYCIGEQLWSDLEKTRLSCLLSGANPKDLQSATRLSKEVMGFSLDHHCFRMGLDGWHIC